MTPARQEPLPVTDLRFPIAWAIGVAREKGYRIFPGRFFSGSDLCCPLGAILVADGIRGVDESIASLEIGQRFGMDDWDVRGFAEGFDTGLADEDESSTWNLGAEFRAAHNEGRL